MRNLGPTELALVFGVFVLLFGAKKLPELARGSGRALRIFKAETKGLTDDDDAPDVLGADPVLRGSRSAGPELSDDIT